MVVALGFSVRNRVKWQRIRRTLYYVYLTKKNTGEKLKTILIYFGNLQIYIF